MRKDCNIQGGFAWLGSCVALRNYPGPSSRSLLHAARGKVTIWLKSCKIKLCEQVGSVFGLSEFLVAAGSLFILDCFVYVWILAALVDKNTKHRGRRAQPREINQRKLLIFSLLPLSWQNVR